MIVDQGVQSSRRHRLKLATQTAHETLERVIDEAGHFDTLEGYGNWICRSERFHRQVSAALAQSSYHERLPTLPGYDDAVLLARDAADLRNRLPTAAGVGAWRAAIHS